MEISKYPTFIQKGDNSLQSKYRPVSLLSCVSERIIFKHIYNHLKENFILTDYQSGFKPGKSTITQLIEIYQIFCRAVDQNKEIRVVFLDISKAFDRVWHKGLIFKLNRCGIGGKLLNWLSDYLSCRRQRVCLNGSYSDWMKLEAGVPQGSVLGPLLSFIFINDLTEVLNFSNIRLFADDTGLFIEIDNTEDRNDVAQKLNSDLQNITKWSNIWQVTFSEEKKTKIWS